MAELKTKATAASLSAFLEGVADPARRKDWQMKRLADVDLGVLTQMIRDSLRHLAKSRT